MGEIEVQQHDGAGLGVEPRQSYHADPHGNAQVVVEEPHEPDRADQGEGYGEHHDRGLGH